MENTLAGVAGKKFILSYSCGKDSTLCLHKMLEAGAEPMALLVMFNPEAGRSYFHGVDPALLREYGEALELPLLAVPTGGEEYHLSMEAALRRAKEQGAELVCFGDIDMENNRAWGEERCRNVGLDAVYPLWHHDRQENVREVLELARRPFVASHSNSRAVCPHPRNLDDGQVRELAARGCLIGLNYYSPFLRADGRQAGLDDLCRHAEHLLTLGAEDCLALGSDFDGAELPPCLDRCEKVPGLIDCFRARLGGEVAEKIAWRNAMAFFRENLPQPDP